jgi:hypothetical protein
MLTASFHPIPSYARLINGLVEAIAVNEAEVILAMKFPCNSTVELYKSLIGASICVNLKFVSCP